MLKLMIPYVVAVLAAIAIFVAGAWAASWFMGRALAPELGLRNVSDLVTDYALLYSLDADKVDKARALLVVQEDMHVMSIDMDAPYFSDDLAKSACRIMQKVAKQRADNAAKYSPTESTSDPDVRRIVAAALRNPAACTRTN